LRAKRQDAIENEAATSIKPSPPDPAGSVCHRAQGADGSRYGTNLEERMGEVFIAPLARAGRSGKEGLAESLKTMSDPVLVRSAFDLPAEQRAAIQMRSTKPSRLNPGPFETAPDLISGIELTTNGQKVAWSIADYLASLEKGVGELLKDARTSLKPKPSPTRIGP
jgi:F-type H+-transporting ATPase subunit b